MSDEVQRSNEARVKNDFRHTESPWFPFWEVWFLHVSPKIGLWTSSYCMRVFRVRRKETIVLQDYGSITASWFVDETSSRFCESPWGHMKFAKKGWSFSKKRKSFGKLRNDTDFCISSRIAKEAWKLRICLVLPQTKQRFGFELRSTREMQGSNKNQFVGKCPPSLFLCCVIVAQEMDCTKFVRTLLKFLDFSIFTSSSKTKSLRLEAVIMYIFTHSPFSNGWKRPDHNLSKKGQKDKRKISKLQSFYCMCLRQGAQQHSRIQQDG